MWLEQAHLILVSGVISSGGSNLSTSITIINTYVYAPFLYDLLSHKSFLKQDHFRLILLKFEILADLGSSLVQFPLVNSYKHLFNKYIQDFAETGKMLY